MNIQVTFTTQVKAALGNDQQTVTLAPGASVLDAVQQLAATHREVFDQYVLMGDQLLPSILTSVNDQQVDATHKLSDGDHLILLSAISGG